MPISDTPRTDTVSRHEIDAVAEALSRAARRDAPTVLSVIATRFRDLDLADDAVQDALLDAARSWPRSGIPANPGGWLMSTAQRRAIDATRQRARRRAHLDRSGAEIAEQRRSPDHGGHRMIDDRPSDDPSTGHDASGGDERLRLMLLCCHPALDQDAQVALTLRLVAGLTVAEIAAAFLTAEATIAQRIVRAKRKVRLANMTLTMPKRLDERIDAILTTLYLVFNEGYLAHGGQSQAIRHDLMDESIRLVAVVVDACPESAEAHGLLALQRFHRARSAARLDGEVIVLLDEQDRTGWDLPAIDVANTDLTRAMELMAPGPFQVQAMIAAHHANARTAADTDWPAIATLYEQLEHMTSSPVVALNHAVAVAMADGPLAGLAALDRVTGLDRYHLYWATRGELLRRSGDVDGARHATQAAIDLDPSPLERRHLEARLAELGRR